MAETKEKFIKAKEEWAYTLAVQAYIYTLPSLMLNDYRWKILADDTATNDPAGLNRWAHERQQVTYEFEGGGSPNNDTLTSWGLFDLRAEPVILEVPEMNGRYYTIQLTDHYTVNFNYIGRRTTGTHAGTYALVAPGWEGELPEGVVRIDTPTPDIGGGLRILIDNKEEIDCPFEVRLCNGHVYHSSSGKTVPLSVLYKAAKFWCAFPSRNLYLQFF